MISLPLRRGDLMAIGKHEWVPEESCQRIRCHQEERLGPS